MGMELEILLIEDDDVDAERTKRLLRKQGVSCTVHRVFDGLSAKEHLSSSGRPSIILLDLRMPRMDGFEFLDWARGNGMLTTVPAIVLTTSHDESDRAESLNRGATAFISKSDMTSCEPSLGEMIQCLCNGHDAP